MEKKTVVSAEHQRLSSKEQFSQAKIEKSTFDSKEIRSLVKLDFGRLLVLLALKRRLLRKIHK